MTIYFYKTEKMGRQLHRAKLMRVHEDSAMTALLGLMVPEEENNLVLILLEGAKIDRRIITENLCCNRIPIILITASSIIHFK